MNTHAHIQALRHLANIALLALTLSTTLKNAQLAVHAAVVHARSNVSKAKPKTKQ